MGKNVYVVPIVLISAKTITGLYTSKILFIFLVFYTSLFDIFCRNIS